MMLLLVWLLILGSALGTMVAFDAIFLAVLTLPALERLRRGMVHVLRSRRWRMLPMRALMLCLLLLAFLLTASLATRPAVAFLVLVFFTLCTHGLQAYKCILFSGELYPMDEQQQRIHHLGCPESVPFTNRTRPIIHSSECDRQSVEPLFEEFKASCAPQILPPDHPVSRRVHTITSNIVRAARQSQPQTSNLLHGWEVIVVTDAEVNAMCLAGAKIIVFTGLLDNFTADADVATVLCHEIGHAIARHYSERKTREFWFSIREAPMRGRQRLYVFAQLCDYFFRLPLSRRTELEADYIGLMLLAAAGYDPRAAPSFYEKLGKIGGDPGWNSYRSTHPSSKKRVQFLSQSHVMNKALELYNNNL